MSEPQHMVALAKADAARLAGAAVKREIKAGELSIPEALADKRARPVQIGRLLNSRSGWGPSRTRELLRPFGIDPMTRLSALTSHQRRALIAELGRRDLAA